MTCGDGNTNTTSRQRFEREFNRVDRDHDGVISPGEFDSTLTADWAWRWVGEGGLLALEKERPQWRSVLTGSYAPGPWRFLARASSYGKVTSALYSYSGDAAQTYASKTLFDLEVGRSFAERGLLSLSARNLLDTFPDRRSEDNGFGLFLYPPASPFGYNGRYLYARMEIR